MICILLVAGHAPNIESEIKSDTSRKYEHLEGVPKALLPGLNGKRILDYWWEIIRSRQLFSQVFLVTNADKYKHFERWATASEFPVKNIVNDGTTTKEGRIGAVADLELCLRIKNIKEDVLVVSADMMFQDEKFDIAQILQFYRRIESGDLAIYYEMSSSELTSSRGIVEVCPQTNKITKFMEKPSPGATDSRFASVVFYCFRPSSLALLPKYLEMNQDVESRCMGKLMEWLINSENISVYGMKLPTGFQLIGQTTLEEYEKWLDIFSTKATKKNHPVTITRRAYARVGLMGNPSDGFHGKTISLSIKNFWAEVSLSESDRLVLTPHPINDPTEFGSLADLHGISSKEGYLGGLRLLQATCKMFYNYCCQHGIVLARRNFTLKYETNIPRQVGLAGSSAIVTATLKCLMDFFNLTHTDIPKEIQPQLILDVEVAELNINAGLQDRVVQVYEGLVYMDFNKSCMDSKGYGIYRKLSEVKKIPPLFLVYLADPSDSGRIHSNVRQRYLEGDTVVLQGMESLARLTDTSIAALEAGDWEKLADCMNENFSLRLSMYGAEALGESNLKMIEIAKKYGAGVKFPGSGGAVIGLLRDETLYTAMARELQEFGCVVTKILPNV